MTEKYGAVWVSHTSINDFKKCPRAYFLKNVYKDPETNKKIKIMTPPLALGSCVHEVLESLSTISTNSRMTSPIMDMFHEVWQKCGGLKGGFANDETELKFKKRGLDMLRRVIENPGPIARLSIKIKKDLPNFWLSEEEGLILCGKIDWLEYLPDQDAVHIIDFKTGKTEEEAESLQLPIYHLLVSECQQRKVVKASYWYLDHDDGMVEQQLPDLEVARAQVLAIARQIKLARQLQRFTCEQGGCQQCEPFEQILRGEGQLVGTDEYGTGVDIVQRKIVEEKTSEII